MGYNYYKGICVIRSSMIMKCDCTLLIGNLTQNLEVRL